MATRTKASALFDEDLICPRCGERDRGRFCSHCGGTLGISPGEVKEMAAIRLTAVGHSRVPRESADESAVGMVAARYFAPWNAAVLAYELTSAHIAEIVVIADAADVPVDQLKAYLDDFPAELQMAQMAIGPTEISIRLALIARDTEQADTLRAMLPTPAKVIPTGQRTPFWKRKQPSTLKWRTAVVDVQRAVVHQHGVSRFDAVTHELRIAAQQTREAATHEHPVAADYSALGFVTSLSSEVTNYFAILFAFIQNRLLFADLVVNKRLPPERIVGYYVIGIGVSVLLPYVLTLGRVGPAELLSFGNLPPLVDEFAELGVDTAWIVFQAFALHLTFRVFKHRGRLMLTVVSLLFVNAFFQIVDRPVGYLYAAGMSSSLETGTFLRLANSFEQYVRWPLYAFCIVPFMALIYRAELKTIVTAFTVAGVAALLVVSPLLVPSFLERDSINDFNAIVNADRAVAIELQEQIVPLLTQGDSTGDYSEAVARLDPLIARLRNQTEKIAALKNKSSSACAGRLQDACSELQQVLEIRTEAFDNLHAMVTLSTLSERQEHFRRADDITQRLNAAVSRLDAALEAANRLVS